MKEYFSCPQVYYGILRVGVAIGCALECKDLLTISPRDIFHPVNCAMPYLISVGILEITGAQILKRMFGRLPIELGLVNEFSKKLFRNGKVSLEENVKKE